MHYKNGRVASVGDRILVQNYSGYEFVGLVVGTNVKSDTCNLTVVPLPAVNTQSATARECLHLDDVLKSVNPERKDTP